MKTIKRMSLILPLCLLISLFGACTPQPSASIPTQTAVSTMTATPIPASPTPSETPEPTTTSSPTPTDTPAPTLTPSLTPSPIPTYQVLRGEVIIDQAVCHYGPGAPYLYKYGVYKGSNLEILRRVEPGDYIEVQAIGGNNPCWVKAEYMKIKGDMKDLQPVSAEDLQMPPSPYYGPIDWVQAKRSGSEVTVVWNELVLRAGDSSEQTPYIVEAFVCQDGKLAFVPAGSFQTSIKIQDEPGCDFKSRARLIAAEKHGYTLPVAIDWPQAQ